MQVSDKLNRLFEKMTEDVLTKNNIDSFNVMQERSAEGQPALPPQLTVRYINSFQEDVFKGEDEIIAFLLKLKF